MNTAVSIERIVTDNGGYVIRPYAPSDLPAVLASWQAAFGKPVSANLWRWKYHDAPLGHQILLCVHEGGDVAALYGGVPFAATWRGRQLRITQLMDVFSHPLHRRQSGGRGGLYARTALAYFNRYGGPGGSALLYGLPGERAMRLGVHRLRYQALPGGMAYLTADTAVLARLGCRRHLYRLGSAGPVDLRGVEHLAADAPAERLQARRDAAFLHWRFLDHPARNYRLLRYHSSVGRDWRGYAAIALELPMAVLVDLVLPVDDRGACDLLRRIAADLRADGIDALRTWLPGNGMDAGRLLRLGFVRQAEPLGILPAVRRLAPTLTWRDAAQALHYTMADADLF